MSYSTTLSVFSDDVFTDADLRTLVGFLGGYSGTTMRYHRARVSLDRHATYIVATFIAGASR